MKITNLSDKQTDSILDSTARINIWEGSVRSGKTISSIVRFLAFVADAPPGAILAVGKTERTLKRNILDVIAEILLPSEYRLVSGSGECFIFGRRVLLAGANDERSEAKIRGITLSGAYGDELTLWPESFFTMLLSRLSVAGAQFFGSTNPDSPAHWLKAKYLDRESDLDLKRFHFMLDDNPALDPKYIANLKVEYTGLWNKRFIQGLWTVAEGAVFDLLDTDKAVVSELPQFVQHWAGADYGTSNPTVFGMLSQGVDNRLYLHNEWRWNGRQSGRQMTDSEYSKAYKRWITDQGIEPRWTFVDPSAASFIAQLYRDGVRGVTLADNAVLDGIRDVSTLIGADLLRFHGPTTKATVDEMLSYAWDDRKQRQGEDAPLKINDHGPDCVRYLCRGTQNVWKRWVGARYAEAA